GRLTLPCQYALPVSAVIDIVAVGGGPPSTPSRTVLFAMSMTTTASGSVKSKATTRPVSTNFGPISGSPNALSKMPPMYLVTSAESVNPIVLLRNLFSIQFRGPAGALPPQPHQSPGYESRHSTIP